MNNWLSLSHHWKRKRKTFIGLSPETERWKKIKYAKNLAKIQVHYAIFLFHV